jgi:hypothetical protein
MTIAETDRQLSSWVFTAPDKIVVATDLTDLDYLIPYAIAQCEACGASLVISHAEAKCPVLTLRHSQGA